MAKRIASLFRSTEGAVAPTVALALVGLIAVGGIAFDYARMVGMHSELQNAADQAALAAATQLDGRPDAMARADGAARNLVTNLTRLASDTGAVGVATIRFYSNIDDPENPVSATSDANARYAEVLVDGRQVRYALTPFGAWLSPELDAQAMAGMGSALCKVPPVMMCNPNEETEGPGADFDADGLRGAGLRLLSGAPNVPGNFGFLDNGLGSNSTPDLAKMLGYNISPGECLPTSEEVGLQPGQRDVVFNALNTRFDIDTNGANTCPGGGTCGSALNVRKDIIRKGNQCGVTGQGWAEPANPYRPTSLSPMTSGYPESMGHPRDICHAISYDGACPSGVVGDKNWDRDAYFHVNYGWNNATWRAQTGLANDATRYEVYRWELANPGNLASQAVTGGTAYSQPVCRTAAPASVPDRRRMTVAVVNCDDQAGKISGNDTVTVLKWVDVFLVEPAFDRGSGSGRRTTGDQVYVEVIGTNSVAGGAEVGQVVRRDVPYLVE